MSAQRRKRTFLGLGCVAGIGAWIVFEHGAKSYCCDAVGYVTQGLDFSSNGVLGSRFEYMNFRPYGYPFFIALVSLMTDHERASIHTAVAIVQVALLLLGGAVCATLCARLLRRGPALIMAAIVLNPLLLMAATALLSDLLSALCAATAVALVFSGRGHRAPVAFASLALASFAAVLRPASVVFVPMVLLFWIARGRYLRRLSPSAWLGLALGTVLPFVPQVLNNRRLFGSSTPLIVSHLYADQVGWGMRYLKYGTLIPAAPLYYMNPWYEPGSATFGQWFTQHPLHCVATLALHLFSLFDQDFGFTYIADRHPWFRWPLTTINLAYLFIAVATIAALLWRMIRRRRIGATGFFTLAMTSACAGYTVVYLPTAVESRFSLPVYVLLSPFFALGLQSMWRMLRARQWAIAGRWLGGGGAFVLFGIWLSHWLAQQAPALR